MAYSIMLWLVSPGSQAHQSEALEMLNQHRSLFLQARTGINQPPAATRMVYGVYEEHKDARRALEKITDHLEEQDPIEVEQEDGTIFLVPAHRIHYVVMSEFERPKDKGE